jgi:hypothetical protein
MRLMRRFTTLKIAVLELVTNARDGLSGGKRA